MDCVMSTALLSELVAIAARDPGREICGLLLGAKDHVTAFRLAENVSRTPEIAFEIDPALLLATHRAARAAGALQLVGYFHSHPSGDADPSARDAQQAQPDGALWLILAGGGARLWRSVEAGAVHGRFDQVTIIEDMPV